MTIFQYYPGHIVLQYLIKQKLHSNVSFKKKFKIAKNDKGKWKLFDDFIFAKFKKTPKPKKEINKEGQKNQEQDLTSDLWVMARWDFQWLSLGSETERVEGDTSCCWFLIGCLWRRPGSDWFAASGPWRLETQTRGAVFLCTPCPGQRQFYR